MLIDWFTVGAQALNFLILVWLMRRFLYRPILHAIDEREKRIVAELSNADAKKAVAHESGNPYAGFYLVSRAANSAKPSLSSLPGMKYGIFLAGTSTRMPVLGLRPMRARR